MRVQVSLTFFLPPSFFVRLFLLLLFFFCRCCRPHQVWMDGLRDILRHKREVAASVAGRPRCGSSGTLSKKRRETTFRAPSIKKKKLAIRDRLVAFDDRQNPSKSH